MPKKGSKYQKYSEDKIKKILKYVENHTYRQTSEQFKVPVSTIQIFVRKYKNKDTIIKNKPGKKVEEIDYKERYEILKKFLDFYNSQEKRK